MAYQSVTPCDGRIPKTFKEVAGRGIRKSWNG